MTGAIEAIQAWWVEQESLIAQFSDQILWLDQAPDGTALPYAVLLQVAEPITGQTTAYQLADGTYQISCMASTASQAIGLARQVRNAFNRAPLPLQDDQALHCLGGEIRVTKGEGLGIDGVDCWVAYTELDILSQRN